MATRLLIKIDASKIEGLGAKFGQMAGESLGQAVVTSLNTVVDRTYDLARERMLDRVNLSDEYLRRRMVVHHATQKKAEAAIVASGDRTSMTTLSHYNVAQTTKPVNWSNARITAAGHKFSKWPGWTERRGAPSIGIPVDQKAAGRSVSVLKGDRKNIYGAFAIGGKRDSEGNLIVFRRKKGTSGIESLYGPAVYQLFKTQIPNIEDEVEDDLSDTLADAVEEHMRKELA